MRGNGSETDFDALSSAHRLPVNLSGSCKIYGVSIWYVQSQGFDSMIGVCSILEHLDQGFYNFL